MNVQIGKIVENMHTQASYLSRMKTGGAQAQSASGTQQRTHAHGEKDFCNFGKKLEKAMTSTSKIAP